MRIVFSRSMNLSANFLYAFSWTMNRAACVQSCPPFTIDAATAPSAAAAMFASSKTMNGAFPPSSRWSFFTFDFAASMMSFPVAVSPVSETMSTLSLEASSCPTTPPGPVIRFTAPAGIPDCSTNFPSSRVVSGVSDAGFRTAVFPAASAGASFQIAIMNG